MNSCIQRKSIINVPRTHRTIRIRPKAFLGFLSSRDDDAILRKIDSLEKNINQKLVDLEMRVDRKFLDLETRVDKKFDAIDIKFDGIDRKFDAIETDIVNLEKNLGIKISTAVTLNVGAYLAPGLGLLALANAVGILDKFKSL